MKAWSMIWIGCLIAMPRCWVARNWVAWQTRSARLSYQTIQGHENGLLGPTCWVGCVYMNHIVDRDWVAWQTRSAWLGRQTMQSHENGLLGPTCWVGRVYMHYSENMNWWYPGWQCVNHCITKWYKNGCYDL